MKHQPRKRPALPLRGAQWLFARILSLGTAVAGALIAMCTAAWTAASLNHREEPERGDVPGWVLITLMTAGIVVLLMAVAGPTLQRIFLDAMASVTG